MSSELVSVVIPVYNGQQYIHEAIASYFQQDYDAKELVLVDDCSQDGSADILQYYQDCYPNQVRVIKHDENQGLVRTFLDGIKEARGVYISGIAQDDVMFSQRLSRLVEIIQSLQVSMVCSDAYFLRGEERTHVLVRSEPHWRKSRHVLDYQFQFINHVIGPTALFRKAHFARINPAVFQFRNSMEWIHWFQYTQMSGIYYLAEPLLYYRRHAQNLSRYIYETDEFKRYKHYCKKYIFKHLAPSQFLQAILYHARFRFRERLNMFTPRLVTR